MMTKFAVNFSEQSKSLIQEELISPDLLKCPDWPDLVQEAQSIHPMYIHFDIKLGSKRFSKIDWDLAENLLNQTNTKYLNAHLAFPKSDDHEAYIAKINRHLEFLCNRFGSEKILIENPPLGKNKETFQYIAAEPKLFHELIKTYGCGFLLDIPHAVRSSLILATDFKSLLTDYPIEQTKEVHMTGFKWINGEKIDHYEMENEDWPIFEWSLRLLKKKNIPAPEIIAFEYGGYGPLFNYRSEKPFIQQQVPKFISLIKEIF